MLAPHAKTEEAHAAQRQNNEAFLPDRLAGKRGNQMRDQAEGREHGHVDFGLGEKPKEPLPKDWNSAGDYAGLLHGRKMKWGKKVRVQ